MNTKVTDQFFYEELCRMLGQGQGLLWLLSETNKSAGKSPVRSPKRSPPASPNKSPIMTPMVSPRNRQKPRVQPPKKYNAPIGGSIRSRVTFSEASGVAFPADGDNEIFLHSSVGN